MRVTMLAVLMGCLVAGSLAAPANAIVEKDLEKRQTIVVTCIGARCSVEWGGNQPPATATPTSSKKPTTTPTTKPDPPKSSTKKTSSPTPSKTTQKPPTQTTSAGEGGPSSTKCPVPLYYQCGGYSDGEPWDGCTRCVSEAKCIIQNEWYYQCVAIDNPEWAEATEAPQW